MFPGGIKKSQSYRIVLVISSSGTLLCQLEIKTEMIYKTRKTRGFTAGMNPLLLNDTTSAHR